MVCLNQTIVIKIVQLARDNLANRVELAVEVFVSAAKGAAVLTRRCSCRPGLN